LTSARRTVLTRIHLILGLATFVLFLATGQYMRRLFPDAYASNEVIRYQFRANHIYLVLVSFVHLVLGTYLTPAVSRARRGAQWLASGLLALATLLLAWAFFVEPAHADRHRPLTRLGIFVLTGGVALHAIAGGRRTEP
jgi:hypothetical protein